MGRRSNGRPAEPQPAYLYKPVGQMKGELATQIRHGKNLLLDARNPSAWAAPGAWDSIEQGAENWHQYNNSLLERSFTTYEVARSYVNALGVFVTNYRDTRDAIVARRVRSIAKQLSFLEGLHARLDLYVPPASAPGSDARIESARPGQRPAPVRYNITINITGSTISELNTAVEAVHNIESRLTAISNQGSPGLAEALQTITQAIIEEATLDDERKQDLIDNMGDVSEAAEEPPEHRKRGRLIAAIQAVSASAVAGTRLHEVWQAWSPQLAALGPEVAKMLPAH